jgi:hypothetical protein
MKCWFSLSQTILLQYAEISLGRSQTLLSVLASLLVPWNKGLGFFRSLSFSRIHRPSRANLYKWLILCMHLPAHDLKGDQFALESHSLEICVHGSQFSTALPILLVAIKGFPNRVFNRIWISAKYDDASMEDNRISF